MSRLVLVAAGALALLAPAPLAVAANVTAAEVAALAARAGSDPAALATLRAVDRVDGRPVGLAAALEVSGPALAARLHALALAVRDPAEAQPPGGAGRSAHAILAERRFRGSDVPRPLHGPLDWLGRKLHRFYDAVSGRLPGGAEAFWFLLAVAVTGAAALVAVRLAGRRSGRLVERGAAPARGGGDDPRRLEREADEAERAGDLERALRLRFRAGLLRLGRTDAIPQRGSLTNGEIARRLDSSSFRLLAADFDEVVYGRRAAGDGDVERARDGWPKVLDEAQRR